MAKKRDTVFTLRVPTEDLRVFDAKAKAMDVSRAALLRRMIRLANVLDTEDDGLFAQEIEGWLQEVAQEAIQRAVVMLGKGRDAKARTG